MTNKILWFLILGLIVFQSGCALEKYHQGSEVIPCLDILKTMLDPGHNPDPHPAE